MSELKAELSQSSESLAERLRRQSQEILELWEKRVREVVPASRALDQLSLRNSIPLILDTLASALEGGGSREEPKIEIARVHGEERATRPRYSIEQVILEYRVLRRTIFDVLSPGTVIDESSRAAIIDTIEVGIAEAATAFANYQYRLREQFISALAHDLRTPLTAATASAQLILRQPEKIDLTQRLSARIVDSIARTERMIEDLLDSNLVRTGGVLPLELDRSDLRVVIRTCLEETVTAVGERFEFDCPDLPIVGYWDTRYLKRAIENVLVNGVKYGEANRPVRVTVKTTAQNVSILIHNEGPPIGNAELETIFDPFQRVDKLKTVGKVGWGIGLSLVKGVCEAHGGTISVDSHLATGTTFILTVPLDPRAHVAKEAKAAKAAKAA